MDEKACDRPDAIVPESRLSCGIAVQQSSVYLTTRATHDDQELSSCCYEKIMLRGNDLCLMVSKPKVGLRDQTRAMFGLPPIAGRTGHETMFYRNVMTRATSGTAGRIGVLRARGRRASGLARVPAGRLGSRSAQPGCCIARMVRVSERPGFRHPTGASGGAYYTEMGGYCRRGELR